jgi:hypothetical protein
VAISASFYFFPWQTAFFIALALLGVCGYFNYKFAKIIMVFEDDLGKATESLKDVETSMQQIIDMKLFFDTPEIQEMVQGVMESVRMAQFSINTMIKNLTERSKQKFVMVIEEESEEGISEQEEEQARLHPREGTVLSVERSKQQ